MNHFFMTFILVQFFLFVLDIFFNFGSKDIAQHSSSLFKK